MKGQKLQPSSISNENDTLGKCGVGEPFPNMRTAFHSFWALFDLRFIAMNFSSFIASFPRHK